MRLYSIYTARLARQERFERTSSEDKRVLRLLAEVINDEESTDGKTQDDEDKVYFVFETKDLGDTTSRVDVEYSTRIVNKYSTREIKVQ